MTKSTSFARSARKQSTDVDSNSILARKGTPLRFASVATVSLDCVDGDQIQISAEKPKSSSSGDRSKPSSFEHHDYDSNEQPKSDSFKLPTSNSEPESEPVTKPKFDHIDVEGDSSPVVNYAKPLSPVVSPSSIYRPKVFPTGLLNSTTLLRCDNVLPTKPKPRPSRKSDCQTVAKTDESSVCATNERESEAGRSSDPASGQTDSARDRDQIVPPDSRRPSRNMDRDNGAITDTMIESVPGNAAYPSICKDAFSNAWRNNTITSNVDRNPGSGRTSNAAVTTKRTAAGKRPRDDSELSGDDEKPSKKQPAKRRATGGYVRFS